MICDVSKHQGKIDWDKLAPNLEFCMIKASGKEKDPKYAENAAACKRLGVPFHAYHFLYCTTDARAKKEAKLFADSVGNTDPLFYVLDCEDQWGVFNSKARHITEVFEAELRRLKGDTIRVAVYIGHNKYKDYALDYDHYSYVWIPRYKKIDNGKPNGTKPDYPCDIWQYSSKGKLPGIGGNVDLNMVLSDKPLSFFTTPANDRPKEESKGGEIMATNYKKYIMSSGTHYISNSGSDENGKYKGGQAGDQTGKEWRLCNWYNRPWTCVLRYPVERVRTLIAELSIDGALNDNVGYDQGQRDSYWRELKKVGYFPAKIKTKCEEDCTAGVNADVHAAGYLLNIPALKDIPEKGVRSGNMRKYYKAAGFQVLTDKKYLENGDYLLPGDILLYDNHHAAVNVTKGKKVDYAYNNVIDNLDKEPEPSPEPVPTPEPEPTKYTKVKIKGGSMNVRKAPGYDTKIYGVVHNGDVLPYLGETKVAEGKDWYKVKFKDKEAWVSSKYSKLVVS